MRVNELGSSKVVRMAEKSSTTALQWVERLLEPSVTEEMMIEAVSRFSTPHSFLQMNSD